MKKILLIATGGTIASKPSDYGLVPSITSEEIIEFVPQIADMCQVSTMQLMNIDSSNMSPDRWLEMSRAIKENYEKYDGFVITHGTDTLAYTASALSYLVQNSRKPIVLTGSQKSIYLQDTDARKNLLDAFIFACNKYASGVHIVFDANVIVGTRGRKSRTHSYNAFDSINYPIVAEIFNNRVLYYIKESVVGEPIFYDKLNTRVNVIKLIPGISEEIFKFIGDISDVIIVEGFGVGGLPEYTEEKKLFNTIKTLSDKGKIIVFTTAVTYEGSNIEVYQVGNEIKDNVRILENFNMTLESTLCKLMWITGITKDLEEVETLFYKAVSHDILY